VLIVLGLPQRHKHVHLAHAQVSVEVKMYFFLNPQLNTFLGVELNIILFFGYFLFCLFVFKKKKLSFHISFLFDPFNIL
jgi:hypothetical protein